ncbi:MAG: hypothetical protein WC166_05480, partial [Bacteroidales bacterium]
MSMLPEICSTTNIKYLYCASGFPSCVAKFQQKLCKQMVMKNAGIEMAMNMIAGVDKTPVKPYRHQATTGGRIFR